MTFKVLYGTCTFFLLGTYSMMPNVVFIVGNGCADRHAHPNSRQPKNKEFKLIYCWFDILKIFCMYDINDIVLLPKVAFDLLVKCE
jgi:hypothetical protein